MPKRPYKKHVEYRFEVCGQLIAIVDVGKDFVIVEETRKNGQEDTHASGCLVATMADTFVWNEGEQSFVDIHSQKLADGIREYLNEHRFPGRKRA